MTGQELELFREGVDLLTSGKLLKGHTAWEGIWKLGRDKNREWMRGFIQLTGSLLKLKANQPGSAQYLIRKAVDNLSHDDKDQPIVSDATMDYLKSLKIAIVNETLCKSPENEARELARFLVNDRVLGVGK